MSEFDQILTGYRFVDTLYGDSLQEIAARELGDAARWPDIANINGLLPPYLTDDAARVEPGVLLTGSTILVPAQSAPGSIYANNPVSIYETDIELFDGLLSDDGAGDLVVVSGRSNLRQALRHRIETNVGELIFHPAYGCKARSLVGVVNGPLAEMLAEEFVSVALQMESRIEEVKSVSAVATGDVIEVFSDVQPITGKSTKFGVSL
jgi:phage baseplate assembly protein W